MKSVFSVSPRARLMTSIVMVSALSASLSGCASYRPAFLDVIPFLKKEEAPPLHTFDPPKGVDFFDTHYVGEIRRGIVAYQQRDYTTALHELYGLANNGHAEAQYYLGLMFARGEGVPRDPAQAQYWFEKSARGGSANAQFSYANLLWQGTYLTQNRRVALDWYKKAAAQDHAEAQFFLGRLSLTGSEDKTFEKPFPQDQGQAFQWMQKAAKKGYAAAQLNLALMYQFGAGTSVDLAQSLYWFQQAARLDEPGIAYEFSRFYQIRTSPYYDQERALYWLKKAALAGHADANRELAALQKQVDIGSQSLALFGAPLAVQARDQLRRTLHKQGGVTLAEQDDSWFDSYDSSDIWELSDRLFVGYTLETGRVALIQYRLPGADSPKSLADLRLLLEGRYGKPGYRGERVFSDGIYNEWTVKDTRVVLSQGDAHALFLSYYVEPAYAQLAQEQLQHNVKTPPGKAPIHVY